MSTGKDYSIYSLSMWDPETERQHHITETQALAREPPAAAMCNSCKRTACDRIQGQGEAMTRPRTGPWALRALRSKHDSDLNVFHLTR